MLITITINAITCSMLESPSASFYDEINIGAPKSTHFETFVKKKKLRKRDLFKGQQAIW